MDAELRSLERALERALERRLGREPLALGVTVFFNIDHDVRVEEYLLTEPARHTNLVSEARRRPDEALVYFKIRVIEHVHTLFRQRCNDVDGPAVTHAVWDLSSHHVSFYSELYE